MGKSLPPVCPKASWGDDLFLRSMFSWDAQGTQWHRCRPNRLHMNALGPRKGWWGMGPGKGLRDTGIRM